MKSEEKIKTLQELIAITRKLKSQGKKIVQTQGIFDIIHPGIIRHLDSAKSQGDVLISTVVRDIDVNKGPGYPIFTESLRAENVASVECVDFVAIVEDPVPYESVKILKPDIFARGQKYDERDPNVITKLHQEEEVIKVAGCKIHHTPGEVFSSRSIINRFLDIYSEETRNFLKNFKESFSAAKVISSLQQLRDLKVLVIGDTIIDEYYYCEPMGKSLKDNLVVNRYLNDESFAGGTLAVANHIAGLCDEVHLVSLLGSKDSRECFIKGKLRPHITYNFFYNHKAPTIVKRRFIDHYLNQKLFELCYIDNVKLSDILESQILEYIKRIINRYDLVLVADFGHGLITPGIISLLEENSKILAVNVQTNGANAGYNMITKYHKISYACIDEPEARLACQDRYGDINTIIRDISTHIQADLLIVTRGKKGSSALGMDSNFINTPAFASRVIDRIGAGDAYFAFTAPCFARGFPVNLISFVGNAVGALAVQVVGNREPVEPQKLYEFIYTLIR